MPNSIHLELTTAQSPKHPGRPCGDVVACRRTTAGTLIVLGDGIGSGIRAHIAAEMCVCRIMELFRLGFSQQKAVQAVARSMTQHRSPDQPYAAFSVAWIRTDGMATILSYEAPEPIVIGNGHADRLTVRNVPLGEATVAESNCYLTPGTSLLLMSDGITQAGLGTRFPIGWGMEGVTRFVNESLAEPVEVDELPDRIRRRAKTHWSEGGDDCTVVLARCRRAQTVTLLTGPPADRSEDARLVRRFLRKPGKKIVCGGSTAEMVARELGTEMKMEPRPENLLAPPGYRVEGIDLVTEGAVTLNQVYRLVESPPEEFPDDSAVFELCRTLQTADRIEIIQGDASNHAGGHIAFRQRGVLPREEIVPLLVERLRKLGKLVFVTEVERFVGAMLC